MLIDLGKGIVFNNSDMLPVLFVELIASVHASHDADSYSEDGSAVIVQRVSYAINYGVDIPVRITIYANLNRALHNAVVCRAFEPLHAVRTNKYGRILAILLYDIGIHPALNQFIEFSI